MYGGLHLEEVLDDVFEVVYGVLSFGAGSCVAGVTYHRLSVD